MSDLVRDARLQEVQDFMLLEAEALDDGRFRDWLAMMGPEVDYRMPVRSTRDNRSGAGFSATAFHFQETRYRLEMRIARLESGSAWAEEPRSRTRHFVTNVRVRAGAGADEVSVKSNLLLYRTRGDERSNDLLSAERHDLLRRLEGQWKLVARTILLDSTTLPTHNLSVFL
jgi:3-phenylpropionate/cinnamic acid dioxygenase small subunit